MLVTKNVGGIFTVYDKGTYNVAVARGNLKATGVYAGDEVFIEKIFGTTTIVDVLPRKNLLVRPPLANIDNMFIVIAPKPKPDFLLVDKMLAVCEQNNISPIIVINKIDLDSGDMIRQIKKTYAGLATAIIEVSAKTGQGIERIKDFLFYKISGFAGQSAVGKSSILNAISPKLCLITGDLSKKLQRGKQTTRHSEIYIIEEYIKVADTPGFSNLDVLVSEKSQIISLMPDIFKIGQGCKYSSCTHTNESPSICAVKQAVKNGKLAKSRYDSYSYIYKNIVPGWEKKYDKKGK